MLCDAVLANTGYYSWF